jgi:hypothetical protein
LLSLLVSLAGCVNAPEKRRSDLRNDVERTPESEQAAMRGKLRAMLIGGPDTPPDNDPHLLMGPLADESVAVRLECAIALGKLQFTGRTDKRRVEVIQRLRGRVAFDRDDAGRPYETEFLVRSAMVNSVIAQGGRDAAIAVYDVAERVYHDLEDVEASLYTSATDRGLLDRCFQGLADLTGVGEKAAAKNRFDAKNLDEHLDWWADQIADMPQGA